MTRYAQLRFILGRAAPLVAWSAGASILPFFQFRENRTATGAGLSLFEIAPAWSFALLACGFATVLASLLAVRHPHSPWPKALGAVAALLAGPLLLFALAFGTAALGIGAPLAARISFGWGFWLSGVAAYGFVFSSSRLFPGFERKAERLLAASSIALVVVVGIALAVSGAFENLAIAREFASRKAAFGEALAKHSAYALASVAAAALVALPLGRVAARNSRIEKPLFFAATLFQTVPTLSLLGLLIVPLSALSAAVPLLASIGFRGVGWAPAFTVLFLYAILPIAANARAGFAMVSRAAVDAGRGLGMGEAALFFRVELPLAAPSLVAGLRTALAQNLGNAILAGLIGGGGMGSLVFLGLAQAAPDLVLLGALPVVAAAFAADRLLAVAEEAVGKKAGLPPPDEISLGTVG